jgi:hypothetical protein
VAKLAARITAAAAARNNCLKSIPPLGIIQDLRSYVNEE